MNCECRPENFIVYDVVVVSVNKCLRLKSEIMKGKNATARRGEEHAEHAEHARKRRKNGKRVCDVSIFESTIVNSKQNSGFQYVIQ